MGTVIVVGAGGTLAQACSYRPSRGAEHPPLDGNFFERTAVLAKREPLIKAGVQAVRAALAASGDTYDPWEGRAVTMEQFFADVYYTVANGSGSAASLSVFVETLRLYRRVLTQTTDWVTSVGRLGAIDRLVRKELENSTDLTVVTFNHDLVLEEVAARLPRTAGKWCLRSLYGDVDLSTLNWRTGRRHPNHGSGCPHMPPFELLKLHGSMNWLMRSPHLTPNSGTLFPPQRTKRKIYVANRALIQIDPKIPARGRQGGRSWYLWPLVVPPIYDKQRITGMALLQQVWDKAYRAIAQADRLVLCGYSIPDADVLARQMLRTALRQNDGLTSVECINPDASIVGKLHQVLDMDVIRFYANIENYLIS